MSKQLLAEIRVLSGIIQNSEVMNIEMLKDICEEMTNCTQSSIIVINKNGQVVTSALRRNQKALFPSKIVNGEEIIDQQINNQFRNVFETRVNVSVSYYNIDAGSTENREQKLLISPLKSSGLRIGTIIFYKDQVDFSDEQIIVAEFLSAVSTLVISNCQKEENTQKARNFNAVKSAVSTLSYSELEAVVHIFKELEEKEGLLVASKVADKAGITRSVIVNALRKLESAGVIESRSLGMKGTYIKVINNCLPDEINKLR